MVQFMGIYGVLLGTITALLYRTNDFIIYSNIVILKRSPLRQYAMIGANFVIFGIIAILFRNVNVVLDGYLHFMAMERGLS